MSKAISIRLPDQLLEDVKAYAKGQGVGVTDIIIQGIHAILQPVNTIAETEIMSVKSLGSAESPIDTPDIAETVYIPDPVRPAKQPKGKTNAAPIVNAMLSGISKRHTVTHHPQCKCGMCKAVDPSALLSKSSNKAFFNQKPKGMPAQPDL